MPKNEPNVKDKTEKGKINERLKDFIVDLRSDISQDDNDRANWKLKMVTASNQRLGVKRYTDLPYPGAPDIPLPETDKLIKKSVAPLVNSAWAPKKMARVALQEGLQETPELREKVIKSEMAINQLLRSKSVDWFRKLTLAADNMKHYGHCIFRVFEDFKTRIVRHTVDLDDFMPDQVEGLKSLTLEEKKMFTAEYFKLDPETDKDVVDDIIKQFNSGEEIIEFETEEITSMPNIEIPSPSKIIVPSYTTDINKASRVTYEIFMTKHEIEDAIEKDIFRDIDLEALEMSGTSKDDKGDIIETQKDRNEGVESNTATRDLFRIHIVNTWWKPKKKGRSEKWVFVFMADVLDPENSMLYSKPFHFDFEGWDYEKCDNEIKDTRYHASRGIPEQIRAIQEIMERSINNMLIRDEMNNCPMWEVSTASEILDQHVTFAPNQKIPVSQIGTEIKKLNENISVDVSSERIMQILKASAEEYMSSTDQLFRNATNAGGGKTKGEINMGIQQSAGPISMEVVNFNNTLSRVYQKVFEIYKDRLGTSIFIDGIEITREDFNFPADVRSNGNLEVSDQMLATQKSFARLQVIAQLLLPSGVSNMEDLWNAASDWLEKDGVKNPEDFVTDPKVAMEEQIVQMQQMLQQLQQQAQQGQEIVAEQQKSVKRNQKKIEKDINNAEGELQGIQENAQGV